jgi:putative NIF3 family GTP cyclohydrolase 1 type 2
VERLTNLVESLDLFFAIRQLERDPGFSRFIPMVYEPIGFDWQSFFEADFVSRFNGLMLRGTEAVKTVFCSVFPAKEVLHQFLDRSQPGDLLFLHHPLDMECGDPRGAWGRGFVPIPPYLLDRLKARQLSFYACHIPLDYNQKISTGLAIAQALNSQVVDKFLQYGDLYIGLIGQIEPLSTAALIERLQVLFEIPYVDFEGVEHPAVTRIAIVPGNGDVVTQMQEAEAKGVQAYLTGEIHSHIDNDYGRQRFQQMMDYAVGTSMSLIGVSHAASEYLVMRTQMKEWFEQNFAVEVQLLPLSRWWR